jgi:hypothetical protein
MSIKNYLILKISQKLFSGFGSRNAVSPKKFIETVMTSATFIERGTICVYLIAMKFQQSCIYDFEYFFALFLTLANPSSIIIQPKPWI